MFIWCWPFLFATGLFGLMRRRTFIGMLIAGELIFSAASLNFMTMNRFFAPDPTVGQIFVLFIMALAATAFVELWRTNQQELAEARIQLRFQKPPHQASCAARRASKDCASTRRMVSSMSANQRSGVDG